MVGDDRGNAPVSYTHLRAHETDSYLVCRLMLEKIFFLMIRRPPRSTLSSSSAASDVYKRQEQTRAKNKETLTNLVNNKNVTNAQKDKAMQQIMQMTEISEKETATENLLAAKGFSEAVVTILSDSVDVVVNADDLTESQIAQIEDIVKRKTECSADKIVISPVGKKK